MTSFEEKVKAQPFSEEALKGLVKTSPSLRYLPRKDSARRRYIQKLSLDTTLTQSVKSFCDQLNRNPSSYKFSATLQGKEDVEVSFKDLRSIQAGHRLLEGDIAPLVSVMDSIFCLLIFWHASNCPGKGKPKKVAEHFLKSDQKEDIAYCKEMLLHAKKIVYFCSGFLKDLGTVFHLSPDSKK